MPDTNTTTYQEVQIPRFKDKVMYIPANISKTKKEASYVISASFKGIVRLSPNNHNTTYETPNIQLSIGDDLALGTTYSDSIKFDDSALNSMKSNADITKRMIIGSDSDGYLVPFRISENNFEFDNLGVIGITEADKLTIFTTDTDDRNNTFILNGERMPYFPQTNYTTPQRLYKDKNLEQPVPFHEYDVRDVVITGDADNSYLVYGTIDGNGKRTYRYKQSSAFIKELILEALLDLQTIPTGSIHWFPVTIDQYKLLVEANGKKPNKSFNGNEKVDPLLRDFLLCDGRRYNNKDFPELAKILWKENITRWEKKTIGENKCLLPRLDTECNNYGPKQNSNGSIDDKAEFYTFRVPDLRHAFISSIYLNGTQYITSGKAEKPRTNVTSHSADITGSRCVDYKPPSSNDTQEDKHKHFICYGNYAEIKYTDENLPISNDDVSKLDAPYLQNGAQTHVLTPFNHPYTVTSGKSFKGFHYRVESTPNRGHTGLDAIPSVAFLSIPSNNKIKKDNFVSFNETKITHGVSSDDIPSFDYPTNYSDINDRFSGNTNQDSNETYVAWNDYMSNTYGNENTPKFYTMLPFIKI